jgi:aminoglycoside phosphotransferase (APT) family kinase protein
VNDERTLADRPLEDALLEILRAATGMEDVAFDGTPRRLTGGFWATLVAFRLRNAPTGWRGDLVARVMPDAGTAARETVVQSEVAAQGYPTPVVHLAGGPDAGLGQAYMVMDLAAGGPLLGGLGGAGAIAALPSLARRLPDALARAMAHLHRLDPGPVRARLTEAGAGGLGIGTALGAYAAASEAHDRPDLVAAARWLDAHPAGPAPEVVCHGDLHPFNLLIDDEGAVTVLDWSTAVLAPAAYDVAFTGLLLAEPPVSVPRALRPLIRGAGGWLARRFRGAYARHAGVEIDRAALRWHEGVVCLRALVEVAGWVSAGMVEERAGHPWLVNGPAFARRLSRLTGATVRPR